MSTTTGRRPRLLRLLMAPALLLERTRGRKRLALFALYLIVGSVPLAFLVRAFALHDLPDLGDPFDVAAFRARPDDAFPFYQRAMARYQPPAETMAGDLWPIFMGWKKPTPEFLAWADVNREAL